MTVEQIMEECRQRNEAIGAGGRSDQDLRSDARYILMHREGITAETLCMMLTDAIKSSKKLRQENIMLTDAIKSSKKLRQENETVSHALLTLVNECRRIAGRPDLERWATRLLKEAADQAEKR
jgi:hypothetical protein